MSQSDYLNELKRNVSFLSILEHLGWQFSKKKSTKRCLHYQNGGDHIYIYANKDTFHNGYYQDQFTKETGDVIQFLINKQEVEDFQQALKYLAAKANLPEPTIDVEEAQERGPFKPYKQAPLTADSYIIAQRHLSLKYLQLPLFKDSVFQSVKAYSTPIGPFHATIFPYRASKKLVGQELRNHEYMHFVEESNLSNGMWHSKPMYGQDFYVAESSIDALSYGQINNLEDGVFWASGGSISKFQLVNIFQAYLHSQAKCIHLLGDNDLAGAKFNLKVLLDIIHQYKQLHYLIQQKGKEWQIFTYMDKPYVASYKNPPNYIVKNELKPLQELVDQIIRDVQMNFIQHIPKNTDFNKDLELLN